MSEPQLQPIADNLWWMIPGKLAGVRKPTAAELVDLQAAGVGAIVSVMDDPANLDLYEQAKLSFRWLPTKGGTAPTLEQIQELQAFVEQQHQLGNAVAVHCTSGNRRTGTMLAAYLIRRMKRRCRLSKRPTPTPNCAKPKSPFCAIWQARKDQTVRSSLSLRLRQRQGLLQQLDPFWNQSIVNPRASPLFLQ